MAKIIQNIDFGEVRLSLKEYNEMRDRIRQLEEYNKTLIEERDEICDENKVRVRRQIIRIIRNPAYPQVCDKEEIIEDRLINMGDVTQELDQKLHDTEEGLLRKCKELESNNERTNKTLDECQRQKINLEQEIYKLKHRTWWQRLLNK